MLKKSKLVQGVGINDFTGSISVNGKVIISYQYWLNMLERCYSQKYHNRKPTYNGCTVCEEWLYFTNFKKWFDENYREGFHLDKDILVKGNKIYSPSECCFVPLYINNLPKDNRAFQGDLPMCVSMHGCSYRVSIGYNRKSIRKSFKFLADAVVWYSTIKSSIVSEQVERALKAGDIDQRIADALLSREF